MPKDFSRAETLTKEQLRKELKKRGIVLPDPKALKQEYIDLYNRKILRKKSVGFSSDEEEIKASVTRVRTRKSTKMDRGKSYNAEIQSSPRIQIVKQIVEEVDDESNGDLEMRKSPRIRKKPSRFIEESEKENNQSLSPRVRLTQVETMTIDGIEVSELTDAQLSKELRTYGMDVGPIGPSTRRVYERRLAKAISGEWTPESSPRSQPVNGGGYSDHDSADEVEEDVEVLETPPAVREMRSKRRTLLEVGSNKDGSATRRRPLRSRPYEEPEPTQAQKDTPIPSSGEEKEALKPDRRWVPVWVQFLIVIAIAVFFYLVSQSMESNPAKRIPV